MRWRRRRAVRVIDVGKRVGCPSAAQARINARSDPFVVGRGAEEAAALRAAGVRGP